MKGHRDFSSLAISWRGRVAVPESTCSHKSLRFLPLAALRLQCSWLIPCQLSAFEGNNHSHTFPPRTGSGRHDPAMLYVLSTYVGLLACLCDLNSFVKTSADFLAVVTDGRCWLLATPSDWSPQCPLAGLALTWGSHSIQGLSSAGLGLSPTWQTVPWCQWQLRTHKKEPPNWKPYSDPFHCHLTGFFSNPHFPEGHQKHAGISGFRLFFFNLWRNDLQLFF